MELTYRLPGSPVAAAAAAMEEVEVGEIAEVEGDQSGEHAR